MVIVKPETVIAWHPKRFSLWGDHRQVRAGLFPVSCAPLSWAGYGRSYEQEVFNADLARKIFELRTKAGLSQRELAQRVGTSASAICRLEDADYEGHSVSVLKRIAEALDKRVEIRFASKRLRTA